MGCLFHILLFPFELLFDLILDGWLSMMLWIVPEKHISNTTRVILKIFVIIFCAVLLTVFFIGILAAALSEATVSDLWAFIYIPLGISVIQIIWGVIVRLTTRKK